MADFAHLESSTYTVWKYQDFSATQILREINFEESKSSKNAIFTILEALCVKMAF